MSTFSARAAAPEHVNQLYQVFRMHQGHGLEASGIGAYAGLTDQRCPVTLAQSPTRQRSSLCKSMASLRVFRRFLGSLTLSFPHLCEHRERRETW